jgi:MinD-like ATPase involved in chromosome partitioning or flagellar assembly
MSRPIVTLILASGAAWESTALALLERDPGVVVLRRCVDVPDLLAAASAGQADAAVVALDAPGFDQDVVDHLRRFQVRPVAILAAGLADQLRHQATRLGVAATLTDDRLPDLSGLVRAEGEPAAHQGLGSAPSDPVPAVPIGPTGSSGSPGRGRVLAVWGPGGAPGRTTVAVAVAAELAARRRPTTLVDADPYGGTVAAQLGVLDEVSGLLSAARLSGGALLEERFESIRRALGEHLSVVTGLPRADRWVELRGGSVEHLLEVASARGDVVVDTGFSIEPDPAGEIGSRPARNQATFAALAEADEVLVVGSADPVGLARLARASVELNELAPGSTLRVVVNRMRPSLGWSHQDVAGMLGGFVAAASLHFLPDDRLAVDRALVAGRSLVETGDSALRKAVADLVDALAPDSVPATGRRGRRGGRRVRRRTASTGRRR